MEFEREKVRQREHEAWRLAQQQRDVEASEMDARMLLLGSQQDTYNFLLWQEGLQRAEVTTRSLLMVSESQDLHTLKLSFATTRHGSHARSDLETVEDNGRGLLVMLQHAAWISLVGSRKRSACSRRPRLRRAA
uniref:Resolvase/invertase-type recombinase catalytic domain-containing protein n=1 Tax=Eutreptiella gymnastica TaxID=73025 RepID=A0A7S4CTK7_9EUGL